MPIITSPRNDDVSRVTGDLIISAPYVSEATLDNTFEDGQIKEQYLASLSVSSLNFIPILSTGGTGDIVATLNASTEGLTIDASLIEITGSVTFASGYDPTDKVDELGGSYASAASGARVLIFPDANTGIQVIDNAAGDVFKTIVGGTDVGDVIIGAYATSQGAKWDKSAGKLYVKGDIVAGSITGVTISGVAITGGSLTGATIKTASSGVRIEMTASDAKLSLYDAADDECALLDDYGGYIMLKALDGRDLTLDAAGGDIYLDQDTHIQGDLDMRGNSFTTSSGSNLYIASGINLVFSGTQGSINCGNIDCDAINMNDADLSNVDDANIDKLTVSEWMSISGNIDMNGNDINELDEIGFNTRSSASSKTWALYMYDNGGYGLKTRMDGGNWSVDQTSGL